MVEYSYCGSDGVVRSAVISECRLYRYRLDRVWDTGEAQVLFVMLNPSTADATVDDRTICRCMEFARAWGYGGLVVGNLFAYRATNPQQLKNVDDPVGFGKRSHVVVVTGFFEPDNMCMGCPWQLLETR